jgi:magnesium chelatase family protein
MIATVESATLVGVDAVPVSVEVDLSEGLPSFSIIGLGDASVKEARYRVQAALRSCGYRLPPDHITVNLAPADIRKDGAALDLSIALGLLLQLGAIPEESLAGTVVVGELGLDGALRPVRGALAVAMMAEATGARRVIVPRANAPEAAAVPGVAVLAPRRLEELVDHLDGRSPLEIHRGRGPSLARQPDDSDLADVRGQSLARRALEIAAAGRLSLLMVGNPGCGKTMLARRLPALLPPLTEAEALEVTKVWSASGLTLRRGGLVESRPFRAPHTSISQAGMVGGGNPIRPGEVSLSHRGVLFLDELAEMPRRVLETLRQPLEDREVVISRARQSVRMPAAFMLVGATNPCPCGWYGHAERRCRCSESDRIRYRQRVSGPMLDRMDLVVDTVSVPPEELVRAPRGESSADVRARVETAEARAAARPGPPTAELGGRRLWEAARLDREATALFSEAATRLSLSARSSERVLRVSRTIADLDDAETVGSAHLSEALAFRESSMLA